ncbi:MAG: PKD domain-containing protein [Euryarchaeota archaeon]|nr:PKD domain-containing protein [Euryarchaeota archaeon]MBT5592270.1 PKD domain-containing protein [Euryarchaeota archaeon]
MKGLGLVLLMCSFSLAGCTELLDTTAEPRATMEAYPLLIQEGEMVTFDARESDAVEGVITEYRWDFGDGEKRETVTGFTSHTYKMFGAYTVTLTVENDQGGVDDTVAVVVVNGAPVIDLKYPENPRAGDSILLDASASADPEGNELSFSWDLDWSVDSDGDGDVRNDVDSSLNQVLLPTNRSGIYLGSVTIDDGQEGVLTEVFELNVSSRRFSVVWQQKVIEQSWSDYLAEGDEWRQEITPGSAGRIISYEAVLELENDLVQPYDNFTLLVTIPEDNYQEKSETEGGNITANENAKATISEDKLNPLGAEGIYDSDSIEMVIDMVLNQPGSAFGQSPWILIIQALQSNPDSAIEILPDPDPGNDWTLTIKITIQEPVITEIAFE